MVNIEVIRKRLEQLNLSLKKIKRYQSISLEKYMEDDVTQDVVEYNLFIAINMMVDIAARILVDNKLGTPDTMAEAFEILYREKYITQDDLIRYKNMVAFRNILSHEYVKVDKNLVYDVMKHNVVDFEKYILFINDNFM